VAGERGRQGACVGGEGQLPAWVLVALRRHGRSYGAVAFSCPCLQRGSGAGATRSLGPCPGGTPNETPRPPHTSHAVCDEADALQAGVFGRRGDCPHLVGQPLAAAVDAVPRRKTLVGLAAVRQQLGRERGRQALGQLRRGRRGKRQGPARGLCTAAQRGGSSAWCPRHGHKSCQGGSRQRGASPRSPLSSRPLPTAHTPATPGSPSCWRPPSARSQTPLGASLVPPWRAPPCRRRARLP
jgi:hypothetical protein